MTATDTSPVSVASYFVNMYFSECLQHFYQTWINKYQKEGNEDPYQWCQP